MLYHGAILFFLIIFLLSEATVSNELQNVVCKHLVAWSDSGGPGGDLIKVNNSWKLFIKICTVADVNVHLSR